MSSSAPVAARRRAEPLQERARQTYEHLLDVAVELLAEVGIERISTNLICQRAGMTPPALYRYFPDKYAVLDALGRRLFRRQNDVLLAWIEANRDKDLPGLDEALEDLVRQGARVMQREPGAVWILRALRAVPQLVSLRVENQRWVCDRLIEVYAPRLRQIPRAVLWRRMRIAVEFTFAIDEMLLEETRIPRSMVTKEMTRILRGSILEG